MLTDYDVSAALVHEARDRRRYQRDDLCFMVRFKVLQDREARALVPDSGAPSAASQVLGTQSYVLNLSAGGLGLCGRIQALRGRSLKEGDVLAMEIKAPRQPFPVRCLGSVAWVELEAGSGSFQAGVAFTAVNAEDLRLVRNAAPDEPQLSAA
jgi:hypothetical protein